MFKIKKKSVQRTGKRRY